MSKSMLVILCCMLVTLCAWGSMYSFQQHAQKIFGPWRAMILAAIGWVLVALLAAYFGGRGDSKISFFQFSSLWGVGGGVCSAIGTVSILLAFRSAQASGDMASLTWIMPMILSLLPIATVIAAYFLLQKPAGGYIAYLSPGYLTGLGLAVLSAVLLFLNKPR